MHLARRQQAREGKIFVLTAIMLIPLLAVVAFACDVGHIAFVRNDLQNAADAAALAGTVRLRGAQAQRFTWTSAAAYYNGNNDIRAEAERFVEQNLGGGVALVADRNIGNNPDGDIVIGYINPSDPTSPMTYGGPIWNSVRVTTYRSNTHSGELPLFIGPVLGRSHQQVTATATATLTSAPWSKLLPITIHIDSFTRLLDGALDRDETDYYTYNPDLAPAAADNYSNRILGRPNAAQPDGVHELRVYPEKNGAPGNFGTVDFGHLSGSTDDIRRQIYHGPSAADRAEMAKQGLLDARGRLVASNSKKLKISGDTGISWTIEQDLRAIIGQTRSMPIYDSLKNPGTNAEYTVIGFINVVITEAGNYPGGNKTIRVQPIAPYVLFDTPDQNGLGSTVALTR